MKRKAAFGDDAGGSAAGMGAPVYAAAGAGPTASTRARGRSGRLGCASSHFTQVDSPKTLREVLRFEREAPR